MNLAANKENTGRRPGRVLGLIAALLAYTGNPKNMAICVACFNPGYFRSRKAAHHRDGPVYASGDRGLLSAERF